MDVIVLTSNRYSFLLGGYSELFNRHWGEDARVTVLGFDPPEATLPGNFSFMSLGRQDRQWSDALIPFFSSYRERCFFMCFEDHFLISDVDRRLMEKAERLVSGGAVHKAWMLCKPTSTHGPLARDGFDEDFYAWRDNGGCLIPTSLCPSVWGTEYFRKLLMPGLDCWGFEERNKKRSMEMGAVTIYPREWPIYPSIDAMRRRKFDESIMERREKGLPISTQVWQRHINDDDIGVFYRMRKEWKERCNG